MLLWLSEILLNTGAYRETSSILSFRILWFLFQSLQVWQKSNFTHFDKFLKGFIFSVVYLRVSINYPLVCFLPLEYKLWLQAFFHYLQLHTQGIKRNKYSINWKINYFFKCLCPNSLSVWKLVCNNGTWMLCKMQ